MTFPKADQLDHYAELVGIASEAELSLMLNSEAGTMTVQDPKDGVAQIWYPKTWGQARAMLRVSVANLTGSKPRRRDWLKARRS